jgi:hypothetical protein
MNNTIADVFAIAGFWACFIGAAAGLGLVGAELLTKLDNAVRGRLGPHRPEHDSDMNGLRL